MRAAGTDRAAFLARVRVALGRDATPDACPQPPTIDESLVRLVGPDEDLVARFERAAAAAGMTVHTTDASTLGDVLREIIGSGSGRAVATSLHEGPVAEVVRDTLAALDATTVAWRDAPGLAAHFDADFGITDVEAALAETGTIVVASDAAHSRGTFIVPPVHIAIVPEDRILPDMIDLWPRITKTPAACTVLVTGPSKTADIEGILITGVHGPGVVHVIVVR